MDIGRSWKLAGNYSYVHAADKYTGLPPNLGGGGMPPQTGFLRLRYQPPGKPFWMEGYSTLAGRQERLSSLILRTAAPARRGRAAVFRIFSVEAQQCAGLLVLDPMAT